MAHRYLIGRLAVVDDGDFGDRGHGLHPGVLVIPVRQHGRRPAQQVRRRDGGPVGIILV